MKKEQEKVETRWFTKTWTQNVQTQKYEVIRS